MTIGNFRCRPPLHSPQTAPLLRCFSKVWEI
jgi:hypothetical protein